MNSSVREAYLETQILTATPQRLRLMLIDGAIRKAKLAQAAWQDGDIPAGLEAAGHCRDIVCELIAGIGPEQTPLIKQVMGIYLFLFSTLVEAQVSRDPQRLADVIRVLDEERTTWQEVCLQMPERPVATNRTEEVAPLRVDQAWNPGYATMPARTSLPTASAGLSLEA